MAFSIKNNVDDVFFRNVIVGALSYLKKKVTIWNQISDTQRQIVDVPFFFSLTGDEKYLQDAFTDWLPEELCNEIKKAEGNYDPIPRGVLKYSGWSLNTESLTNPQVRSTYNKDVNGNIEQFSAYTQWFPMTLTLDIEILVDSMLDIMKIQQSLIRDLYKSEPFVINFEGFQIKNQINFPDQNTVERQFEFSYGENDQFSKITFAIEIETYMPSIDKTTEFNRANSMENINLVKNKLTSDVKLVTKERKSLL